MLGAGEPKPAPLPVALESFPAEKLVGPFAELADPRVERTRRHLLLDIVGTGLLTVFCGGEGWQDLHEFGVVREQWLPQFLQLPNGIPSVDTFRRVRVEEAYDMAVGVVRPGGVISRVGVSRYEEAPIGFRSLFGPNITLTGGPAPVRAYIERLPAGVLDGSVQTGRVFDRTVGLADAPLGHRAMSDRESLEVLIRPRGVSSVRSARPRRPRWLNAFCSTSAPYRPLRRTPIGHGTGLRRPGTTGWVPE